MRDRPRASDIVPAATALSPAARRRAWLPAAVALLPAGGAVWYGFLEASRRHPSLKLGAAMALAGLAMAALLMARPSSPDGARDTRGPAHTPIGGTQSLPFFLACASMGSAVIHFAVVQQHLAEYWLYGGFFVAVALSQMAWSALILTTSFRLILVAGAVGNALVVVTWVVTRTYGSVVGPAATERAPAGFGDIVSTILELILVAGSLLLLARPGWLHPRPAYRNELVNALVLIAIVLTTSLALYSAVGGPPFVSHVG